MNNEFLLAFVLAPLSGLVLGYLLARPQVLSGKMALGLSLLPFVGLLLARVFC